MKWLLVVSSLTGLTEVERETTFQTFESEAACETAAARLTDLFAMQQEALDHLYETEFPSIIVPYNWSAAFCLPTGETSPS